MTNAAWGNWTLNTNTGCLEHQAGGPYELPVYEMTNSAEILDWVFQIEEKTWASSEDIGDLVTAVREIIGRGVASGGVDHVADPKDALASRYGVQFK